MPRTTCPRCNHLLRTAAIYWSGDQHAWSMLPQDRAAFEATCHDPRKALGDGIVWCPALCPEAPGLDTREVAGRFQSLGDNCEFGLMQRWAGAEPLDLLRLAGFDAPFEDPVRLTTEAIAAGFEGLGDPAAVVCKLREDYKPRQYLIWETRWNLHIHPERSEFEITPDALRSQQARVLAFRRRRLLEDLASADRIFVWRANIPPPEHEIRGLIAALRRYGPNRLLWVQTATADKPPGHAEDAGDGLIKGYVARLAPRENAADFDLPSWLAVCRGALRVANLPPR
jgi:hypothetical protein